MFYVTGGFFNGDILFWPQSRRGTHGIYVCNVFAIKSIVFSILNCLSNCCL